MFELLCDVIVNFKDMFDVVYRVLKMFAFEVTDLEVIIRDVEASLFYTVELKN